MSTITKTATATKGYRLIFRGKNKAGKYLRAVRTVQVAGLNEAYYYLAENGDEIAKSLPFTVAYTNVFVPLCDGHISFPQRAALDLEV